MSAQIAEMAMPETYGFAFRDLVDDLGIGLNMADLPPKPVGIF